MGGSVDRSQVRLRTLQKVKQLGARTRHFQSQEVREALGYGEQSEEAHYMHSVIQRLKGDILEADKSRARHQFLWIAEGKEGHLDGLIQKALRRTVVGGASNGASGNAQSGEPQPTGTGAPRRVMYLEERVSDLESRIGRLDGTDGLIVEVAAARAELTQLQQVLSVEMAAVKEQLAAMKSTLDELHATWM